MESNNNYERIKAIAGYELVIPDKYDVVLENTSMTYKTILELQWDFLINEQGHIMISRNFTLFKSIPRIYCKSELIFSYQDKIHIFNIKNKTITLKRVPFENAKDISSTRYFNYSGKNIVQWDKNWNSHNLADVITNDDSISSICCIDDRSKYMTSTSNIVVFVLPIFSKVDAQIVFSYRNGFICISINRCQCVTEYSVIYSLANYIIKVYRNNEVSHPVISESSNTAMHLRLRSIDPQLFIGGYSRESATLPIPSSVNTPNSIEYPIGSNNYYTAPEGEYPGLKINRLSNNDKFPYIITCYKNNHMRNTSSITYNYYRGTSMLDNILLTFDDCINELKLKKISKKIYPDICFQECYKLLDTEILSTIYSDNWDKSTVYRYFEELYNINIIIVEKSYNEIRPIIPECQGPYFWNNNSNRQTVVFIKGTKSYSIYTGNTGRIISLKESLTTRYEHYDNVTSQHIDYYGKCRCILYNSKWKDVASPPYNCKNQKLSTYMTNHENCVNDILKYVNTPNLYFHYQNRRYLFFESYKIFWDWVKK